MSNKLKLKVLKEDNYSLYVSTNNQLKSNNRMFILSSISHVLSTFAIISSTFSMWPNGYPLWVKITIILFIGVAIFLTYMQWKVKNTKNKTLFTSTNLGNYVNHFEIVYKTYLENQELKKVISKNNAETPAKSKKRL